MKLELSLSVTSEMTGHGILIAVILLSLSYPPYVKYAKKTLLFQPFPTPGRRQSRMLLTINERGSKMALNSVFDCHLSPVKLCL